MAALSFFLGGFLGICFLRADVTTVTHGTTFVVAHFHLFAVGFVLVNFYLVVLRLVSKLGVCRAPCRGPQAVRRYLALLFIV